MLIFLGLLIVQATFGYFVSRDLLFHHRIAIFLPQDKALVDGGDDLVKSSIPEAEVRDIVEAWDRLFPQQFYKPLIVLSSPVGR